MSTVPPTYKKLGKKNGDLFKKLFYGGSKGTTEQIKVTHTAAAGSGLTWKTEGDRETTGSVAGSINSRVTATYKIPDGFGTVEAFAGTNTDISAELTVNKFHKNLTVTATADQLAEVPGKADGLAHTKLAGRWAQDKFNGCLGLKDLHKLAMPAVDIDFVLGAGGVSAGASLALSNARALTAIGTKINYGCKDVEFNLETNGSLDEKTNTLSHFSKNLVNVSYSGFKNLVLGAQLNFDKPKAKKADKKPEGDDSKAADATEGDDAKKPAAPAGYKSTFNLVGQYTLDATTTVKGKVDTNWGVFAGFSKTLSNPNLKWEMSCNTSLKDSEGNCNWRCPATSALGFSFSLGDL